MEAQIGKKVSFSYAYTFKLVWNKWSKCLNEDENLKDSLARIIIRWWIYTDV